MHPSCSWRNVKPPWLLAPPTRIRRPTALLPIRIVPATLALIATRLQIPTRPTRGPGTGGGDHPVETDGTTTAVENTPLQCLRHPGDADTRRTRDLLHREEGILMSPDPRHDVENHLVRPLALTADAINSIGFCVVRAHKAISDAHSLTSEREIYTYRVIAFVNTQSWKKSTRTLGKKPNDRNKPGYSMSNVHHLYSRHRRIVKRCDSPEQAVCDAKFLPQL